MNMKRHNAFVIAIAAAVFMWSGAARAQQYTVSDLGKVGTSTVAHALNNAGQAAGAVGGAHGDDMVAFFWPAHGGRAIGRPQHSDYSEAFGLNSAGIVTGVANLQAGMRGFTWGTQGANLVLLPPLAGDSTSAAYGINDAGVIAGYSSGPSGGRAVIWQNQVPQIIVPITLSSNSQALGINASGAVVGFYGSADSARGFLWTAANGLQTLTPISGDSSSQALVVNASGVAAGISQESGGATHAVIWDANGVRNLGMLSGGTHSQAYGINTVGAVVGTSGSSLGMRAFIWDQANGLRDLNTLIPANSQVVLASAVGINDSGQILAIGNVAPDHNHEVQLDREDHSGVTRVYLLTPTAGTVAAAH
jgi:probable HAF family extracellular repeat protein